MLTFSNCRQFYTYTWVNSGEHKIHKALPTAVFSQAGAGRGALAGSLRSAQSRRCRSSHHLVRVVGPPLHEHIATWDQQLHVWTLPAPSFPSDFHVFPISLFYIPNIVRERVNISVIIYVCLYMCIYMCTITSICLFIWTHWLFFRVSLLYPGENRKR